MLLLHEIRTLFGGEAFDCVAKGCAGDPATVSLQETDKKSMVPLAYLTEHPSDCLTHKIMLRIKEGLS
jgi:hypothetical protein